MSAVRARRLAALTALLAALALFAAGPSWAVDPVPEEPSSLGQAILYHLEFAVDIEYVEGGAGLPIGQGDRFPSGVPLVITLLGWDFAPAGTELRLRLYQGERLVFDDTRIVQHEQSSGVIFPYAPEGGVPDGAYAAQLDYNGVPDEVVTFQVGGIEAVAPDSDVPPPPGGWSPPPDADASPSPSPTPTASPGPGTVGGGGPTATPAPVPYADPADVLVVTREAVLRDKLGPRTDEVLAAAAQVGDLRDLDADGTVRDTPEAAVPEVRRLLQAGSYRYLLILGNDDAVPYVRVENPLAADEQADLDGWELPADWLASDDPYADLDGDTWGVPDLAVARIPSSEDADLLLTQLGENSPPASGAFALVNQKRRSQAGAVLEVIDDVATLDARFAPPIGPDDLAATTAGTARYTYILLHGIGVTTDAWLGDLVAWQPWDDQNIILGEWRIEVGGQVNAITVEEASSTGVVNVGACYGAWTLDTVQEPQHKTAENNLALRFLRSGTRAFVADTHLSYSVAITPQGPYIGRTGFEVLFWQGIVAGQPPIDAFQSAKVTIAEWIDIAVGEGEVDAALLNVKTLHEMVYLGRP